MSTIIVHAKAALLGNGQEVLDDATLVAVAGVIQQIDSRKVVSLPAEPDQVYNFDDFVIVNRYYTANVVWINVGYSL